jgi:V-type H+-transporting ATPase subunit a
LFFLSAQHTVDKYYDELQEVGRVIGDLETSLEQAIEFDHVLIHTGRLLRHRAFAEEALELQKREARESDQKEMELFDFDSEAQQAAALAQARSEQFGFQFLAGVVSKAQHPVMERQVFLASRGNCFTFSQELEGDENKIAFILYFLGSALRRKLVRICESLSVRLYLYPENASDVQSQRQANSKQITDLTAVLTSTTKQRTDLLHSVGQRFGPWKLKLIQEKAIYTVLNKMAPQSRNMIANMWVPTIELDSVQHALDDSVADRGIAHPVLTTIETDRTPPTHFYTNEFTRVFQGIVNTYGIPRYQEANPAIFTIVTFPFLFGMMYGDVGHGSFLCMFGCYLVWNYSSMAKAAAADEMMGTIVGGRYLLAMMGAFAVYVGLCYNDCMSLSLNLFGSHWHFDSHEPGAIAERLPGVYPFGLDPAWHDTVTELAFQNSLKMKLSVIFGITQMTFGIILSLTNHLHYKNYLSIWCEFIPMMIFMLCLFGYMIVLILTKWSIDWSLPMTNGLNPDGTPCVADPPNLITTIINMFLNPGFVECKSLLFEGQAELQASLVSFAFLAVPWLLFAKPTILYLANWQKTSEEGGAEHEPLQTDEEQPHDDHAVAAVPKKKEAAAHGGHDDGHGGGGPFDFGNICINQMIHTIEFVLGTVSNTASYLRLWALSLAHAELAKVFFDQILMAGWESGSAIGVFVGTAIWMSVTFAVLMSMDVLECFLHALRLHWVEFQGKFFFADGIAFQPFSYKAAILADKEK